MSFVKVFTFVFAFLKFVFYKYLSTRLKAEADWYKKNVLDLIRAATRRELYLQTFYTIPHTYNTIQYDTTYNTMLIAENSTCIHTGRTKIHNTIDMTLYIIQNRVTYTCNTSIYLPHNLGEKESSTPGKYIYIYI